MVTVYNYDPTKQTCGLNGLCPNDEWNSVPDDVCPDVMDITVGNGVISTVVVLCEEFAGSNGL